jgi:hypothetical protein
MSIGVDSGVEAKLIVKGEVTLNSNGIAGMYSFLSYSYFNPNLEIDVENGSTLESCGNGAYDIYVYSEVEVAGAATFSGTGYICDQDKVEFGNVDDDKPVCQDCT